MTTGRNEEESIYPIGIRFWYTTSDVKPKIEVWDCLGLLNKADPNTWCFRNWRTNELTARTYWELIEYKNFKPFLLNLVSLRKKFGAPL